MGKRKKGEQLTGAEISVLRMLWDLGPSTLAEAHQEMCRRGAEIGYTTMQTRLDRLVEKQVLRKSAERPAKYEAAVEPDEVSAPLLNLLLERVSGAVPLFAHLIQDPSLTPDDLREMKRLIAEAEKSRRPGGDKS